MSDTSRWSSSPVENSTAKPVETELTPEYAHDLAKLSRAIPSCLVIVKTQGPREDCGGQVDKGLKQEQFETLLSEYRISSCERMRASRLRVERAGCNPDPGKESLEHLQVCCRHHLIHIALVHSRSYVLTHGEEIFEPPSHVDSFPDLRSWRRGKVIPLLLLGRLEMP